MNERYLFRVFNLETKVMIDTPDFLSFDYECNFIRIRDTKLSINEIFNLKYDKIIIDQCTGLKDKNKKPVFEGDIIKYDDTEEMSFWTRGEIGVVKFKPGRFSICLSPDYDGKMTGTSNMMQEDMEDCITIIGNIHQNRELLEKGGK